MAHLSFSDKINILIKIYNLPAQQKWDKYLEDNHFNYFLYLVNLEMVSPGQVIEKNPDTYILEDNKYFRAFLHKNNKYFKCDNYNGKVIIDVGCGWGLLAIWYALCGAKTVYALGYPYQIEFINKLIEAVKAEGISDLSLQIKPLSKPVDNSINTLGDLPAEIADHINYNDVFEHISDKYFDNALKASYNTLKKGGILISVTHNTDNPKLLEHIKKYWDKLENEGLFEYRKKYIQNYTSLTSDEILLALTTLTRGLDKQEINDVLNKYLEDKKIIYPDTIRPALDLEYDYLCENYISPEKIKQKMIKYKFKSSYYPALLHSRRFIPVLPFVRIFSKLLMSITAFSSTVVFEGRK